MRIEWTDPAIADLDAIERYISRDSPPFAKAFVAKIFQSIEDILKYPNIGRRQPDLGPGIREIILQKYRVIYRTEVERILILAIIHGARDLGKQAHRFRQ